MIKEKNIMISMRDGVRLATDIYRPEANSRFPVLIARTPYNKDYTDPSITRFVDAGYVVTVQDVRGRYSSEGNFIPYEYETEDALELYKWLRNQPWCDGNLGTFGGSYLGGTQWLPARKNPDGLKAMIPEVTFDDLYSGCCYQGGAKVLHDLRWTVESIIPDAIRRSLGNSENSDIELPDTYAVLNELPMAAHPAIKKYGSFYLDWLDNFTACDFWRKNSPNSGYQNITVPALNISGWYDIFVSSTLNNFNRMKQSGGSENARKYQRLIMGPWSHMNFTGVFPEISYGENSSAQSIDLVQIKIDWFDRWLKGADKTDGTDLPVKIFVMGINQWRDEAAWPLPDTKYKSFYLHSGGNANSLNGDGVLSEAICAQEASDCYTYDPMNPVPTIGGQVILPGENAIGPRDQHDAEIRDDVLVYSTAVLEKPVEVTGPIQLKLFASSDSLDTDFTAKLVDVFPDGRAILLTDGIIRARFRESFETAILLEPEVIYEFTIDMGATANVFLPGHRIRLEVSSSNFPKFNRNSNTGGNIPHETAEEYKPAINRVFHDKANCSQLILPVIERNA